jgi:hypothetical protein
MISKKIDTLSEAVDSQGKYEADLEQALGVVGKYKFFVTMYGQNHAKLVLTDKYSQSELSCPAAFA